MANLKVEGLNSRHVDPARYSVATIGQKLLGSPEALAEAIAGSMPGGFTSLSRFDEIPVEDTSASRAHFYIYSYMGFAMRLAENDLVFQGKVLLGNKDEETLKLLAEMGNRPEKVAELYDKFFSEEDPQHHLSHGFRLFAEKDILRRYQP